MGDLSNITFFDLNIARNCSLAGRLAASALDDEELNIQFYNIILLVRAVARETFRNHTAGEIVDWYLQLDPAKNGLKVLFDVVQKSCFPELCKGFSWDGNSDLAGVGVTVSYGLEVVIATTYIVAFAYLAIFKKQKPGDLNTDTLASHPFWAALQTSVGTFWDSALIFAVAVAIASLTTSILDNNAPYTRTFASLSTLLTTALLIVTWPLYAPNCKDPKYRRVGLIIVSIVAASFGLRQFVPAINFRTNFELYCFSDIMLNSVIGRGLRYTFGIATTYLITGTLFWLLKLFLGSKRLNKNIALSNRKRNPMMFLLWGFYCIFVPFVFVWFAFGALVQLRAVVVSVSGDALQEREWTFGQVLAVFTWLPTILDFFSVLIGRKRGLERRLPQGFQVQNIEAAEPERTDLEAGDEPSTQNNSQPNAAASVVAGAV